MKAAHLAPLLLSVLATVLSAETPAAGPEALAPFKRDLMDALSRGLETGTVAAVTACRIQAPALPMDQRAAGFEVGRASDRLRNPDNAAPAWVAPVLEEMSIAPDTARGRHVTLADGREGWVEPIRVAPMCLQCHGASLAPEVTAALDAGYPQDRARGYAVGDLRGVFWVVPLPVSGGNSSPR